MIDYAEFLPSYPSIDDPLFQQKLYNKEEFFRLKLQREQEQIAPGEYLQHQTLIQRYLSQHSDYDAALLFHEMGTGKTCAAFAMSEALKQSGIYRGCYVFARGQDLLTNLMRNLVYSCSTGYPIDKTDNPATEMARIRKILKKFYSFNTFLVFARGLTLLTDEQVKNQYSNMIFIIDEVHNIKGDLDSNVYIQFHRLFHLAENTKRLLMTGTPMTDEVSELADVMNLILPLHKQLSTGAKFTKEFLIERSDGTLEANTRALPRLKEYLHGMISYLRAPQDIDVIYEGVIPDNKIADVPQFRLVTLRMRPHQEKAYSKAYAKDISGEKNSIYTNARQASLFVFPNGTWGNDGLKTFTISRGPNKGFALSDELRAAVSTLESLVNNSVKYADTIKTIINHPGKNIYVYSSLVSGSGSNLFCKILECYGFSRCTGREMVPGKRYMLLTGDTLNINGLVKYFNMSQNIRGKYCQVIIGSKKIAEGFTFKNIQIEIINSLHWNYTETAQSIKRALRFRSHLDLEAALGRAVSVRVRQVAAITRDINKSIDYIMYTFARQKDISIKRMERVCQEVSFDCPINYERNVGIQDGSRDCNYQSCDYKCDGSYLDRTEDDITTFELYYSNYLDLIPRIAQLYLSRDEYSYITLKEITRATSDMQLLKCLAHIIENNYILFNSYKYPCYLREEDNIFFLVNDPLASFSSRRARDVLGFYVRQPLITRVKNMDEIINYAKLEKTDKILTSIIETPPEDLKLFRAAVNSLPEEFKDAFIMRALELSLDNIQRRMIDMVYAAFEEDISILKRGKMFAYESRTRGRLCVQKIDGKPIWKTCKDMTRRTLRTPEERTLPSSPEERAIPAGAKYLGIVQDEKFCIQDLSKPINEKDKRRIYTGAVCVEAGWKKDKLVAVVKDLGIRAPEGTDPSVFWSARKTTKAVICSLIRGYLEDRKLIRKGKCGTARKTKT